MIVGEEVIEKQELLSCRDSLDDELPIVGAVDESAAAASLFALEGIEDNQVLDGVECAM